MKALYVTSVEPYAGKTAVCLALGKQFQEQGLSVGYLKPLSNQPWRTPDGKLGDEDSAFVQKVLGFEPGSILHSPVIITPETLRERLAAGPSDEPVEIVLEAAQAAGEGKDLLLVEGGASLRDGYAVGLSNLKLAEALGAPALVLVRYRNEMQCVDDALAARFRLGELLLGVILNHVPELETDFVAQHARPFLERQGVPVIGALPRRPRLSALSVGELRDLLQAEVLTENYDPEALAESLTVGAMALEAALSRFRRQQNKAVITGGDRTDIQLAALETSTVALILTGNLHPSPLVLHQAETLGVPILLVSRNTMETVEAIEATLGKTRLGQHEKLEAFMALMAEHVDTDAVRAALELG